MPIVNKMKLTALSVVSLIASTDIAAAQSYGGGFWTWFRDRFGGGHSGSGGETYRQVPEIDAGAGLLAIAAVFAAVALAWELRRRRDNAK